MRLRLRSGRMGLLLRQSVRLVWVLRFVRLVSIRLLRLGGRE
ncbi:MAG: hypothetical protein ACRDOA_11460 [Streptosporangiaceae bacterium]